MTWRLLPALVAIAACAESAAPTGPSPSTAAIGPGLAASPTDAGVTASPPSSANGVSVCRNPADHVYHPYRLQVRNPCMTVTGVVDRIKDEPDGDYHVRLHLDRAYAGLIDAANVTIQAGDLILEPVCIHAITQADAVSACSGYSNPLTMPPPHTHVVATGAYVLDLEHGWMELHPLWDIHPG